MRSEFEDKQQKVSSLKNIKKLDTHTPKKDELQGFVGQQQKSQDVYVSSAKDLSLCSTGNF